jgi:hypothetical protein
MPQVSQLAMNRFNECGGNITSSAADASKGQITVLGISIMF